MNFLITLLIPPARRSNPLAQNASDNFRVNIYEKRDQIEVDNQRT